MGFNEFLDLIRKRKQIILFAVFLFLLISLALTFISPLKYRATTKLLIMQNNNLGDAYSLSRSNQFLSSVLSEVVYSSSFFEQALAAGYNIDQTIFSADQNKNMKKWRQLVSAKPIGDTGMIVINTYNKDKYQAGQMNQAIAYILQTKHSLYHGLGDKVSVKVIDKTAVSNWPVKPNVILNASLGIILGLFVGFCLIYLYPEKEFRAGRRETSQLEFLKVSFGQENYQTGERVKIGHEPKLRENARLRPEDLLLRQEEDLKEVKIIAASRKLEGRLVEGEEKDMDSFTGDMNNLL
ncbi:MAG: Wzz/FepE/Etk N-terminal domain-containing protein [Patescibacteria group bacterium]